MSATPKYLNDQPVDAQLGQDILEVREWERFKWLAKGLAPVIDRYEVGRLQELLDAPPTMPGQREKVVVLLALKATPQARAVLEKSIDTSRCDESFRQLYKVALRYADRKQGDAARFAR